MEVIEDKYYEHLTSSASNVDSVSTDSQYHLDMSSSEEAKERNAYSDDFDSESLLSPRKSGLLSATYDYSDDFTSDYTAHLKSITHNTSLNGKATFGDDCQTSRSILPQYSSDFESLSSPRKHKNCSVASDTDYTFDEQRDKDYSAEELFTSSITSTITELDSEEEAAKDSFVQNLILSLKRPKPTPRKSKKQQILAKAPKENTSVSTFCKRQVSTVLKNKLCTEKKDTIKSARVPLRGLSADMDVCTHGVPFTVINKLKTEATLHNLKKAGYVRIHRPDKCPYCRDKVAQFACDEFAAKKAALVRRKYVDEQVEQFNQNCNDQVYLMSEVLRDLPRINTHPQVIYNALMQPLERRLQQERIQDEDVVNSDSLMQHKAPSYRNEHVMDQCELEYDMARFCEKTEIDKEGKDFWKFYFSRLKGHPSEEYFNLYEEDS